MADVSLRRLEGLRGVRWLVTVHQAALGPEYRDITYEVLGEAEPDVQVVDGHLYINGCRANEPGYLRAWHEVDVPQHELLQAAFRQQRRTLEHNQLVNAFRMVLCTVAVSAASAFFTAWRLRARRG